ncbi:unnamed protein product [Clonostachys rosea f. rosea IK726]|uniref:Uncharacterized protein n=1 Tax=Clonostachys rosea f. rosea IK726 TaxID=1349383 RepID=A0ACA9UCE5_BIOOC|nr:unnamed protein product [Clonostachys rosea f. rosea IK726]
MIKSISSSYVSHEPIGCCSNAVAIWNAPVTNNVAPLTYPALGLAKYNAASATSATVPHLPSGESSATRSKNGFTSSGKY